jgi:hypothetical protein
MKVFSKSMATAAIVCAGVLGGSVAAQAATVNDTRYPIYLMTNNGGFREGYRNFFDISGNGTSTDCTVFAALPLSGSLFGDGLVPCNHRKGTTVINVKLAWTTPAGSTASVSSGPKTWTNSYGTGGSHWVPTPTVVCVHNYKYQVLTDVTVDGVHSYSTTSTPIVLC